MGHSISGAGSARRRPSSPLGDERHRGHRRRPHGRRRVAARSAGSRVKGRTPLGYYKDPEKSARHVRESSTASATRSPATTPRSRPTARSSCSAAGRCASTPAARRSSPRRSRRRSRRTRASCDAVAVGVPDDKFGEAITAVVELAPGATLDEGDVIAHVKSRLAAFKAPKRVLQVDTIGRAPNGKVDYKRLRRGRTPSSRSGATWRSGSLRHVLRVGRSARLDRPVKDSTTFRAMADLGYDGKVAIITGAGGGLGPRARAAAGHAVARRSWSTTSAARCSGEGGDAGPGPDRRPRRSRTSAAWPSPTPTASPRPRAARPSCRPRSTPSARVDIVINNAGILRDKTFHNMTPELARPGHRRPPQGRLLRHPAGVDEHARAGLRPHRQHRVELRHPRQLRPGELRRRQDGPRRLHPGARRTRAPSTTSRPTPSPRSPAPA